MSDDYLLGHDEREWARLSSQHQLWREGLLGVLSELREDHIVEVGCGTGELLRELGGVGIERDPRAAAQAREKGLQVIEGDLFEVSPPHPVDVVVARWVFSFLPDPGAAVGRLAGWLRPGGHLVVQDYDHDALAVWPRHPAIDAVVEAFRAAYRGRGGDLWVAPKMPALLHAAGLDCVRTLPEVKSGPPGSAVWTWVEDFLFAHLSTVHAEGHLDQTQVDAFRSAWSTVRERPGSLLVSPVQLIVVGRRPA